MYLCSSWVLFCAQRAHQRGKSNTFWTVTLIPTVHVCGQHTCSGIMSDLSLHLCYFTFVFSTNEKNIYGALNKKQIFLSP